MTLADPLQEQIWELQCAARIAEQVGDLPFAKVLKGRVQELEEQRAQRKEKEESSWAHYCHS